MTGSLLNPFAAMAKSTIQRYQRREVAASGILLEPAFTCTADKSQKPCVSIQQAIRDCLRVRSAFLLFLFIALMGVSLPATSHARLPEQASRIFVGAAKIDVTPLNPVVLAGYGSRTKEFEGIDTRLWARCLVIGKTTPVVIVALDNAGVPAEIRARLLARLNTEGIADERLVVAATHTHNAPTLAGYAPILWAGRTTPDQKQRILDYTDFVVSKMESVVLKALRNRQPMTMDWAQGTVSFGGNRRVIRDGKWTGFGFQRNGPVDNSLPVLAARDADGKVRAIWVNYACHCTTVGSRNHIGGDWAGYANQRIEETFGHAVALTTIGCGADIGPQPSGSLKDADRHGLSIAKEVQRLLKGNSTNLPGPPKVSKRTIQLPLTQPKPRPYWEMKLKERGFEGQLAKFMLIELNTSGTIPKEVEYPVSAWTFGDKLAIVFLAGEVGVDYSVRLNKELDWSRLWISAWANAMPGYIPSRRVLQEGGYEPGFSQVYYAKPGPYRPEVEDILIGAVTEMLGQSFAASDKQPPAPFHHNLIPNSEPATFQHVADWVSAPKKNSEEEILSKVRKYVRTAHPGVKKIVKNDGETTDWKNFSGDFVERRFIRQDVQNVEISWTAAIEGLDNSKPFVVSFIGGLGYETEPRTDGFALMINEQHKLSFDVTRKPYTWVSSDKGVELVYLPTWSSDVDSGGFFFVIIRNSILRKQSRLLLTVRSLGEGSKRWFALDSEQKIISRLESLEKALQ